jgi:alcohol dehydrogenase class IV
VKPMPYFNSPKILYGSGMLKRLGAELQGIGDKAAVITGKHVVKFSEQLVKAVSDAGFAVTVWEGAEPEPSIDAVVKAGEMLREVGPQLVVGFGGGSVIDTAKAAWILYERPDLNPKELDKAINPKNKLNLRRKAKFLAVPTTSGTGSEVNWAIVLTDKANGRKLGFGNNEIVPDIALLVPEFTAGMTRHLTASTGLDVLGHALDGYTARQQNDFSDGLCLQAMALAFEWLPKACADGNDMSAREKMQNAAAISGLGFGNSNTSLCHSLAHAIGAAFAIPHGKAVGITLPYSLEYIASNPPLANTPDPAQKLAIAAKFTGIEARSAQEAVQQLVQRLKALSKEIGEPVSLKEAGIKREQFDQKMETLVSLTSKDINMFSCPCECKADAIRQIFERMYG